MDRARIANQRGWFQDIKSERGCEMCGYNEHPAALEFDHVEPAVKRMQVSRMPSWAKQSINAEISKCRVLCANCHRIETVRRNQYRSSPRPDPRQGFLRLGEQEDAR